MNKKIKLLALGSLLSVSTQTEAQMKTWAINSKNVNVSTSTPVVTSNGLPNTFTAQNCAYDESGNPLFYVGRWKIYNKFGEVIDDFDCISSLYTCHGIDIAMEFPIVPCIETTPEMQLMVCERKYYVFYTAVDATNTAKEISKLFAKIVTVKADGGITSEDVLDASGNRRVLALSEPETVSKPIEYRFNGMAVSRVNSNNTRFLYWVAGRVIKIPLTAFNSSNYGIGVDQTILGGSGMGSSFTFCTLEADLSGDGTKLLWGEATYSGPADPTYFVIGLNPTTGDFDGVLAQKMKLSVVGVTTSHPINGVEFSPNGNEIFVTTGGFGPGHGIYRRLVSPASSSFNYVPGSNGYGNSQLELAPNGLIYACSNSGYAGINPSTYAFPLGQFSVPAYVIFSGFFLPDQIDGENYDAYSLPSFYNIKDFIATTPATWTMSTNPMITGANTIRVMGELSFSPGEYVLQNMNFEFGPNGKITVGYGVTLRVVNSTFKSTKCGEMWKGVSIYSNGTLHMRGDDGLRTIVSDASVGVDVKMSNAKLQLVNVDFKRNNMDVKIVDYTPYSPGGGDILNCNFLHTEPLKLGSSLFPVMASYGVSGIDISTTKTPNSVPLSLSGCLFEGRMINGVMVNKAPIIFNGSANGHNVFKNMTEIGSKAINIDMKKAKYNVVVDGADFININQAIFAKEKVNLTVKNNTIEKVQKHAIEWINNGDCQLEIVESVFKRFQLSAIMSASNTGTPNTATNPIANQTRIIIYGNTFDNSQAISGGQISRSNLHKPTGITIVETALASQQNFGWLRVAKNTMNQVSTGIKVSNVSGYRNNENYGIKSDRFSDIDSNNITVYATYTTPVPDSSDYNSGIQLYGCRGLWTAVNEITSNQYTQWRSMGIYVENTQKTLLYRNVVGAGRGIAGAYTSFGNDIKCNIITKGVNGISLQDYKMRLKGAVHGNMGLDARDNFFFTTSQPNMELYLYRTASNATNLQALIDANQWILNSTPSMLIEPSPGILPTPALSSHLSYIKKSGAPDKCGFPQMIDIGDGGGRNFTTNPIGQYPDDPLHQWQMQYDYERELKEIGEEYLKILSRLIDLEQQVVIGDYSGASYTLQDMPEATNTYEKHYITLYNIIVKAKLNNGRNLDSNELEVFKSIAIQHVYEGGPAIYLARAVLWAEQGLNYIDVVDRMPGIGFNIKYSPCLSNLPQDLTIRLLDNANKLYTTSEVPITIDSTGEAYIAPAVVETLPTDKLYTFVINNGIYPSPEFQSLASWMDNDDNTIALCSYGKSGNLNILEQQKVKTLATQVLISEFIKVYPNPAQNNLHITLPNDKGFLIEIYDITGKKVYETSHIGNKDISTDRFDDGVYVLRIIDMYGSVAYTNRILIQK